MTDKITLKPEEAAEMLGVGIRTLQEWTRDGYIPSIHRGGVRLYSVDALRDWAREQSAYEEARRGKATLGNGVGLQAEWGREVGRGSKRAPAPLRRNGARGEGVAG